MSVHRKKKKYELARLPANTRLLPETRVRKVRVRGGNTKFRALRLHEGNFAWGSETITRRCKILDVVYNATSNELIRTKTLVKGCVVSVDAAPFRDWYFKFYGVHLGKKKSEGESKDATHKEEAASLPKSRQRVLSQHSKRAVHLDKTLEHQFRVGRVLAKITSRPGQVGRSDGQLLEGTELQFYLKKTEKKSKKK
eukprot:CAMPEP_0201490770 /NCGR_PEP_ID=MMETSP0151_2-20130828/27358_1 /ASSEMBLY_ACC=CAM_ASM_000257 /TAXON_ID=200890 /ORGANISM="Paramoeba atlantica, Strain 621/1 / CCAP 1560/9" /LENGTH=195 /DNA_ID=CAMNT_0047876847 /DNA_START=102 /DNA_END=689 /DNA_ORIENTATION=+